MIVNLGTVKPIVRGDWNISESYKTLNIVTHNSVAYMAKNNVNSSDSIDIENETYWCVVSPVMSDGVGVNNNLSNLTDVNLALENLGIPTLLDEKADKTEVISKTNTTSYTPSSDFHPATKAYVDAMSTSGGGNVEITKISEFVGDGTTTIFNIPSSYILGSIDVFLNGINLSSDEYTASDGENVEIIPAPSNDDVIKVVSYGGADVYNKAQADITFYKRADVDALLNGKSSTSHSHNSTYYTKSQVDTKVNNIEGYDLDREWKILSSSLFSMADGYMPYGSGTLCQIPILPSKTTGGYKNLEIRLRFKTFDYPEIVGFKIGDYSDFSNWASSQSVGTDLNSWSGFLFIGSFTSKSGIKMRADNYFGYTPAIENGYFETTLTASQIAQVGDDNGYGINLFIYDMADRKRDMSNPNGGFQIERFEYRFV